MLFRWVRTFVAHFLAKRNLEVYTAQLAGCNINQRPEIRVFTVSSGVYRTPTWKELEKVIRDALENRSEEDTTKIIQKLQERITDETLNREVQRIIQSVRSIMEGSPRDIITVLPIHCEAVVAALLESHERGHFTSTVSSTGPRSNDSDSNKKLAELSKVCGLQPE
jgi:hypothetical protein